MTLTLPFRAMHALAVVAHKHGKMPGPEALTATSVEERKAQQPVRWALRKRPDGVRSEDLALSATAAVRVYSPAARSGGALLYIHGGGFVLGGLDACDHICADLASLTGHVVVSVDYRLAPEDPFPAGLDDCEQALHWLVAQAADLGVDPGRIAVAGDSAGGNLSAALSLRMRGSDVALTHQVLIYPMLDLRCTRDSWITEGDPWIEPGQVAELMLSYAGAAGPDFEQVSPLASDDLTGLPPALVVTSEHDTLRDDGTDYAKALADAGVRVRLSEYARMPHAFLSWPRLTSEYGRCLREVAGWLAS